MPTNEIMNDNAIQKGCWRCRNLERFDEDSLSGIFGPVFGWGCSKRDSIEHFKTFPCNRRLKCYEGLPYWENKEEKE